MDKSKWVRLGIESSRLGFGCMRFPMLENGQINEDLATELLDIAYQAGITYFDTAYVYHNQKSEEFMARCLAKYPRDTYTIATKLPFTMAKTLSDAKQVFNEQLTRLKTDYIDFYLLHGIDLETFRQFVNQGIVEYCESLKETGKIRFFGFSFHGPYADFEEIIKFRNWDFCQIQLNYMDIDEQAGLKGYYLAEELGIPIVIMEPVKGGSLASLPDVIAEDYNQLNKNASLSSWAFRWIGSYPNIKVILSGMSSMDQLEDNISTFTDMKPLNAVEMRAIENVRAKIKLKVKNGCTGCRYCMPCPAGVDIPGNFSLWNRFGMFNNRNDIFFWWNVLFEDATKAKNCVKCGQCEEHCPQKITIRDHLEILQRELDSIY